MYSYQDTIEAILYSEVYSEVKGFLDFYPYSSLTTEIYFLLHSPPSQGIHIIEIHWLPVSHE